MSERTGIPRNEEGQPPTRTPDETESRLEQKEQGKKGGANKERIEEQIDDVRSKA